MERLLKIEKKIDLFRTGDGDERLWVGSMYREQTPAESQSGWPGKGYLVRVFVDGPRWAEQADALAWKEIEEEGYFNATGEFVLRRRDRLFEKLTDGELHALSTFLEEYHIELDLDDRWDTIKRLAEAADAENTHRLTVARERAVGDAQG